VTAPRCELEAGFSLIEALAALAIIGVILGALASVAGQWLPEWRHGFLALQSADQVAQSLDRLAADISSAEYARLDRGAGPQPFRGDADSVMFVSPSVGPDAAPRLDYVRVGVVSTHQGMEIQRQRAPFAPGPIGPFRDPVTVLRAPFRLSFAYQAPDGRWMSSWASMTTLPRAMRLTIKTGVALVASTAFLLKVTSGPDVSAPPPAPTNDPSAQNATPTATNPQ
jgi:general secretion pathway protein J